MALLLFFLPEPFAFLRILTFLTPAEPSLTLALPPSVCPQPHTPTPW